ncbi:MAG TPA: family 43 glycosylhydrolase, partial [Candidatus Kapabacteria bacterium]|nr:family 43 glycosylhydrolase [Candidatus Kapabacteria bacterium]
YYSVGNETYMNIRVATSADPAGPYFDSGKVLTSQQFAIDAHVFRDDDGQHYLFYATDFLEYSRIGTGTVVDRLVDPFTLEGDPRPVTRAKFDWQVYDPARKEKGGVRWHTVEGPFVVKRKGIYYEMFSGGNWQNKTYGVSYATTDDLDMRNEWDQHCDGEKTLPILRTISADDNNTAVNGPGHNSVVMGPSNLEQFVVYHQWDTDVSNRVLSIDRLDWVGAEMLVLGPTTKLQEAPAMPAMSQADPSDQLIELDGPTAVIKAHIDFTNGGQFKLVILTPSEQLKIEGRGSAILIYMSDELIDRTDMPLVLNGFRAEQVFTLDVRVNYSFVEISIEGQLVWSGTLPDDARQLEIANTRSAISHFELSFGWEDLFLNDDLEAIGWTESSGIETAEVEDGCLLLSGNDEDHVLVKQVPSENYELVVNAKLMDCDFEEASRAIAFGFYPALPDKHERLETYPLIAVKLVSPPDPKDANPQQLWTLQAISPQMRTMFTLPEGFDPSREHQFRFRKRGTELHIFLGKDEIGTLDVPELSRYVGLYAGGCEAAFEMVRLVSYS